MARAFVKCSGLTRLGVSGNPGSTNDDAIEYWSDERIWAGLHRFEDGDGEFQEQMQLSQLRCFTSSTAGMTTIAENYVGLDAV